MTAAVLLVAASVFVVLAYVCAARMLRADIAELLAALPDEVTP